MNCAEGNVRPLKALGVGATLRSSTLLFEESPLAGEMDCAGAGSDAVNQSEGTRDQVTVTGRGQGHESDRDEQEQNNPQGLLINLETRMPCVEENRTAYI